MANLYKTYIYKKMEGITISELDEKLQLSGDEYIPMQDSSGTWRGKAGVFLQKKDMATINGQNITNGGNIVIEGGGSLKDVDQALNINSQNAISNKAVTEKFDTVDKEVAKGKNVSVGKTSTPPTSENSEVYFEIGDGEGSFVVPEAPSDGKSYVRKRGGWSEGMTKTEILNAIGNSGGSGGGGSDSGEVTPTPPPASDDFIPNALSQLKRVPRVENELQGEVFSIAFCSDMHYDIQNLKRYIAFCNKYREYIDCELCAGDMVNYYWSMQNNSFNEWINVHGSEDILLTVGNHDTWGRTWHDEIDKTIVYSRIFSPLIGSWGVVQPQGANEKGLMYYYKDYPSYHIRIIVLDCMYWDEDENSWLVSVLNDAKSKKMSVICTSHYCPQSLSLMASPFTSIMAPDLGGTINEQAATDIDSFIDRGGSFITWLCGHIHRDYISFLTRHLNQLVVHVSCASSDSGQTAYCDSERKIGTSSQEAFDIIGVNTYDKILRIIRIGDNMDSWMRERKTISVDYANKKIII